MNKPTALNLALLLSLAFLTSCFRDGENLDDCIRQTRIEPRWIDTHPIAEDEQLQIEIIPDAPGNASNRVTSDIYGVNVSLLTGGYTLFGWEDYAGVDLNLTDQTIRAYTETDGSLVSPTVFSAGSTTTTVELTDGSVIIPLPMRRQVRPLIIEINFIGDGYALVNGVTGILSGIAHERNLENAFPPVNMLSRPPALQSGTINYTFRLTDNIGVGIWYTGENNLIGIDGNATQELDLLVTYTGDNQSSVFTFDITEQMGGFHTNNINEPWVVILTLNLGLNLDVSIVDWISGPESAVVAQ